MDRRSFIKGAAAGVAGGVALGCAGPLTGTAHASEKIDIGECKSVKVTCVSETSWFDSPTMLKDISSAGGAMANQYDIPWTQDNIGGFSALIEMELLDGSTRRILLDPGWKQEWMDYAYAKVGLDKLLKERQIDFLVISHEHEDHLWGIKSVLKLHQDIPVVMPNTFYPEGKALMDGKYRNDRSKVENDIPHTGKRIELGADEVFKPFPGVAIKMFDIPIMLRVRGEQNLFFNVKDKGVVAVTGCCHQGLLTMLNWARRNIEGYKPYGVYGGLHIAAFENWDPKFDDIIQGTKAMGLKKIACNHCTGWVWAAKAKAEGLPIVLGSDTYKSYKQVPTTGVGAPENVYLRNGDSIVF